MAASEAKVGAGSALYVNTSITEVPGTNELADWTGAGGTWTLVWTEPTEVGLPGATPTDVETTHLLSPNRRQEFTPGPVDTGSISGTANWKPADYAAALALVGFKYGYKVVTCATGAADDSVPDLDCVVYFTGHLGLGNATLTFGDVRQVPFTVRVDSDSVVDTSP